MLRRVTVGVLAATRMSLFVPSEVRWLRILAQIAAVTMENARLLEAERRRARYGETVGALATIERVEVGPFCQRMAAVINEALDADRTEVLLHPALAAGRDGAVDRRRTARRGADPPRLGDRAAPRRRRARPARPGRRRRRWPRPT